MRWFAAVLTLLLAAPAAAGPIRLGIQPETPPRDPFVVSVTGHYADFHNGRSHRWKEVPLRAGPRRFIPLGPVNLILNMGVSVRIQHPEYVAESARSDRTPLLLRPVGFDTFRPRSWRSVLESGESFENGGPEYLLGQVLGHFQAFLLSWLPRIDSETGEFSASDESLRSYLPLFEELAEAAMTDAAAQRTLGHFSRESRVDPVFMRNLAAQDQKTRNQVREQLFRIREWLSIPRADRVAVRGLMGSMKYDRQVSEELMRPLDLARVDALLDRYQQDSEARREPEAEASWTNPENQVAYRVRVNEPPRRCAWLSITADLTGVVPADLGGMTKRVDARFCRRDSGEWGVGTS